MIITATEFKTNIGKYLALASKEDILITKNGKSVARLTNAKDGKIAGLQSLRGIIKDASVTQGTIREERLAKYDESTD